MKRNMKSMDKLVLVITGCIAPRTDVFALTVKNTNERLLQYRESILWVLEETPITRIVFADNSGYPEQTDLIIHAKEIGKELEWISFQGNREMVSSLGKGYGEGEIMEKVFDVSTLVQRASYICKMTGRVKVKNINRFLGRINYKHIYLFSKSLNLPWRVCDNIDTRFYGMPITHYCRFYKDAYLKVKDIEGVYLEHAFYECYKLCNDIGKRVFYYPDIHGISGTTGVPYNIAKWKLILKSIASGVGMYVPR